MNDALNRLIFVKPPTKMLKKNHIVFRILIFFGLVLPFEGCVSDRKETPSDTAIDSIEVHLKLHRFDQDLFHASDFKAVMALESKYPDFYPVYMYQIMEGITGPPNVKAEEAAMNILRNFTTVPEFGLWLKNRADSVFPDLNDFKNELTIAMKRHKFLFPKDTIPEFVTFLSPLVVNFPVIEGKKIMGIGLDMYLGSDFKVYHAYNLADQFPNYRIRKMRKDYLLRDLITAMMENKLQGKSKGKRLIDEMLHEGKILYLTNLLLPDVQDSIKMGYSSQQMLWADKNESEIWTALVDSRALYTTDPDEIRDYTSDGPFTTATGFGAGTAPRAGSFIGWKIIQKYMSHNPNLTVGQLLAETDSDQILTQARYKP